MRQQRTLGGAALVLLALHCFTFVVATAASPARGVRFDSSQTAAGAVAWAPAGSAMADPLASRFGISRASSGSGARLATDGAAPPLTARAGAFQFSLTCADVDAARCAKMLGTLQTAGTVYSALLNLTQPVVVAASYMSFCAHPPSGPTQQFGGSGITTSGCPARLKNALGSAFPTSQWNLFGIDGVDPEYTYPQALAKQLAVEPLSWTGSDVTAQFNVDADLWFEGDPAIKATQTDSLYVVVHEMLHGLGISTSWNAYGQDMAVANLPTTNFLTPHPLNAQSDSNGANIAGFLPHSIYDKFLYDTVHQRPLPLYAYALGTPCADATKKSLPSTDFFARMLASRAGPLATDLYKAATTENGIVFVFPDRMPTGYDGSGHKLGDSVRPGSTGGSGSAAAGAGAGKVATGNTVSDGGMNNATAPIQPAAGGAGGGKGDTSSSSTASAASTSTTTSATVSSSTTTKASSTSSSAKASPTTGSGGGLRKRASPIGGSSWPVAPVAPQYAVLYTPPTYALGSSLTHVANVQPGGPDFLLRPVTQTGTALVQLTAANNPPAAVAVAVDAKTTLADALTKSKLSPVGPGTLRMLDALGYTVMPGFGMTPSTHSWFESAEPEWAEVKPSAGRCSSSWMSAAS